MSALAVLWFFLIFVLIAGYFVLDGFDLGVGVLYRALAKDERERALVRRSIGPVWDGNEVWLLTAGGALFAAFPAAYATTFSGFYLAVMLVLFGLIVRAVSLEFRAHDPKWARAWDVCFTVGSLLPALLLGVALGNVIAGIPMAANGDYAGVPLLGLLSPFTLVAGLLGLAMCLSAGAAWVALKAPAGSAVHKRAAKLRVPCQVAALVLFAVATVLAFAVVKPVFAPGMLAAGVVIALVFLACVVASIVLGHKGNDLVAFLLQSAAAACRGHAVPQPGGGSSRQRGRIHHADERGFLRHVAGVDDRHRLRGRTAGAGLPRDRVPRLPRASGRQGCELLDGRAGLHEMAEHPVPGHGAVWHGGHAGRLQGAHHRPSGNGGNARHSRGRAGMEGPGALTPKPDNRSANFSKGAMGTDSHRPLSHARVL